MTETNDGGPAARIARLEAEKAELAAMLREVRRLYDVGDVVLREHDAEYSDRFIAEMDGIDAFLDQHKDQP